jgi:hypothetical protein
MLASVTGVPVPIAVLAVVMLPTVANVSPPPPSLLIGALAVEVESNGSTGIIIGTIACVIIALVLVVVLMHRHLTTRRAKTRDVKSSHATASHSSAPKPMLNHHEHVIHNSATSHLFSI